MAKRKSFVILYLSKRLTFYVSPRTAAELAGGWRQSTGERSFVYYYTFTEVTKAF